MTMSSSVLHDTDVEQDVCDAESGQQTTPPREPGALLRAVLLHAHAHGSPSTPPPLPLPTPPKPSASQILPRLFLSDIFTALNPAVLQTLRITHVISVMEHVPVRLSSDQFQPDSESLRVSPTILHIPLPDLPSADILSHFSTTRHFIDTALHDPTSHILVRPFRTPCMTPFHPIQVHCFKGMSRSPTIVAAYLIATLKLSTDDALSRVKAARPVVLPNRGFRRQLEQYEELLREEDDMVCSEK